MQIERADHSQACHNKNSCYYPKILAAVPEITSSKYSKATSNPMMVRMMRSANPIYFFIVIDFSFEISSIVSPMKCHVVIG